MSHFRPLTQVRHDLDAALAYKAKHAPRSDRGGLRHLRRHPSLALSILTYCAEIVYPENRIVVDYGTREDLVLLAAFRADGEEVPLDDVASHWRDIGTFVRSWDSGQDRDDLATRCPGLSVDQVARALRCSVAEVNEMAAMTGRSWAAGGAIAAMIEGVPDEFDSYVRGVVAWLSDSFALELDGAGRVRRALSGDDRGEIARARSAATNDKTMRAAVFALLDGKQSAPIIWRSLSPAASKSFKEEDDT